MSYMCKVIKEYNCTKFYRKIFCTICGEFSIRMYEDLFECFNDCEITSCEIDENNFKGLSLP